DPGQSGTVPPRDGNPREEKSSIVILGRDHGARCITQAPVFDRLIGQTTTMKIGQSELARRAPEPLRRFSEEGGCFVQGKAGRLLRRPCWGLGGDGSGCRFPRGRNRSREVS